LASEQLLELWAGAHSIFPLDASGSRGTFQITGFASKLVVKHPQENWLMANLPTPNIRDGWRIKSLKIRYRTSDLASGGDGGIDKIGIRDAERVIHEFNHLSIRSNNTWETRKLDFPQVGLFLIQVWELQFM
jgi:hypothetical protein